MVFCLVVAIFILAYYFLRPKRVYLLYGVSEDQQVLLYFPTKKEAHKYAQKYQIWGYIEGKHYFQPVYPERED